MPARNRDDVRPVEVRAPGSLSSKGLVSELVRELLGGPRRVPDRGCEPAKTRGGHARRLACPCPPAHASGNEHWFAAPQARHPRGRARFCDAFEAQQAHAERGSHGMRGPQCPTQ